MPFKQEPVFDARYALIGSGKALLLSQRQTVRVSLIVLTLLFAGLCASRTLAQSSEPDWSEPRQIPGSGDDAHLYYGLVPDRNGNVHLFWTDGDNDVGFSIFYSRWNDLDWSPRVDILLSPLGDSPRFLDALLDETGILHLLFFAGNEFDGRVYYTTAPVDRLGETAAWNEPLQIAGRARPSAGMAIDGSRTMHILFSGNSGPEVYALNSVDRGETWSEPILVQRQGQPEDLVFGIAMTEGPGNDLMATWTVFNNRAFGQAVYLSRMDAGTASWSSPQTMAVRDPDDFGVGYSSVAVLEDGTVHLLYQDGPPPPKRFARQSPDGGQTWTAPQQVFGVVGQNGLVGPMAIDSAGQLHAVTQGRYAVSGQPDVHGIFYIPLEDGVWGTRSPIATGKLIDGFDPQNPLLVSYRGNKLLAMYGNDPHRGLWFAVAEVDAPPLTAQPYITSPAAPVAAVVSPTPLIDEAPTPLPVEFSQPPPDPFGQSNSVPLLLATLPVVILIGLVILIRRRSLRPR